MYWEGLREGDERHWWSLGRVGKLPTSAAQSFLAHRLKDFAWRDLNVTFSGAFTTRLIGACCLIKELYLDRHRSEGTYRGVS